MTAHSRYFPSDQLAILIDKERHFLEWKEAILVIAAREDNEAAHALIHAMRENSTLLLTNYGDLESAFCNMGKAIGPVLVEALRDDTSIGADLLAAVIGKLDYHDGEIVLAHALSNEDIRVRYAAIDALSKIGSSFAANVLSDYLGKGEPAEDYSSIWALQRMGSVGVPALKKALRHQYDWIGQAAEEALKKIGTPDAIQALENKVGRKRIPCATCPVELQFQFPLDKSVSTYGKVNRFGKWDLKAKCWFCGTEMGIRLTNVPSLK